VSKFAAPSPRSTFRVVRGGIGLPRQLSFGPLTVCLCNYAVQSPYQMGTFVPTRSDRLYNFKKLRGKSCETYGTDC